MIEIDRLSKHYPGQDPPALDAISLTVQDGEIFGLLGPSGAGKSTLLRCLNLLERPTGGNIQVDGVSLLDMAPSALRAHRRQMGMIFQHFNLLHAKTVAQNIEVPLRLAGLPASARQQRVDELLTLVGLAHRRSAYPSQLSGGQQQRVGIARALASRPRYLLCDEATSALDADTTASILALLEQINRTLGITIILITHQIEVVKALCHSAALIEQGRVIEHGALRDLMLNPASTLRQRLLFDIAAERRFLARHHLPEALASWATA